MCIWAEHILTVFVLITLIVINCILIFIWLIQPKKNLKHPTEIISTLKRIVFNEPVFDNLSLNELNEINVKIFTYSDFTFSPENFVALCLKAAPEKLLRFKNEILKYKQQSNKHIKKLKDLNEFFNESKSAKKIIPFIKREYANRQPQDIAFLLWALKDLTLLDYTKHIQTHLHKALENVLGNIGTRAALNIQLTNLTTASKSQEAEIKVHKSRIASFLNLK